MENLTDVQRGKKLINSTNLSKWTKRKGNCFSHKSAGINNKPDNCGENGRGLGKWNLKKKEKKIPKPKKTLKKTKFNILWRTSLFDCITTIISLHFEFQWNFGTLRVFAFRTGMHSANKEFIFFFFFNLLICFSFGFVFIDGKIHQHGQCRCE